MHISEKDFWEIGHKLKALRKQNSLTQEDLAGRTGLDVTTLQRLERGDTHRPRAGTLKILAEALGVTVQELQGPALAEEAGAAELPDEGYDETLIEVASEQDAIRLLSGRLISSWQEGKAPEQIMSEILQTIEDAAPIDSHWPFHASVPQRLLSHLSDLAREGYLCFAGVAGPHKRVLAFIRADSEEMGTTADGYRSMRDATPWAEWEVPSDK